MDQEKDMVTFRILSSIPNVAPKSSHNGPRLGHLLLPSRPALSTPHYLAITSRGPIPHITQDNQIKHTDVKGVYMAYEDFVEKYPKSTPPVLQTPLSGGETSRLRTFTAQPDSTILVLGLRRPLPLWAPLANTKENVTICTSNGFQHEPAKNYVKNASVLNPDIVVAPADIVYFDPNGDKWTSSIKRTQKMGERTGNWLDNIVAEKNRVESDSAEGRFPALFAPVLPVEAGKQVGYLGELVSHVVGKNSDSSPSKKVEISGLALHSMVSLKDLPDELSHLPKLSFDSPTSPHGVLEQVSCGIDILTIPFLHSATDAGIALTFEFTAPVSTTLDSQSPQNNPEATNGATAIAPESNPQDSRLGSTQMPLGIDLWSPSYSTDLSPFQSSCSCYACHTHHLAYVHHLLSAKEMLGWTLLAIHNHHVIDKFFTGIRNILSTAPETWDSEVKRFSQVYESELPVSLVGKGPRLRGYQFKSALGDKKRNEAPYRSMKIEEEVKQVTLIEDKTDVM